MEHDLSPGHRDRVGIACEKDATGGADLNLSGDGDRQAKYEKDERQLTD
jgi:hypothetical protein